MKTLLVVLDGVGDYPCKELNGKTPLEAAQTPNIDKLAANSILLPSRIAGKIAPESDVGILSILGINPFKKKIGRGIFEWFSTGKQFRNGWLAIRTNFCTLRGGKIIDRRADRNVTPAMAKKLAAKINQINLSVPFEFVPTSGHRGVVVFKGDFSKHIQNTDPAYQKTNGISDAQSKFKNKIVQCYDLKRDEKSKRSAEIVNEFSNKVIDSLRGEWPANALLLRNAETRIPSENYSKWCIVAEMPLEVGIGKAFKMKVISSQEGDYKNAANIANREITQRDVYVHLKGPDLFGHDGKAVEKKISIEKIDAGFFARLKINWKTTRLVITADHCTPCKLKAHSNDAVPTLISGAGVEGKRNVYCEKSVAKEKEIPAWKLLKLASRSTLRV
ncbi:MAG: phosphoglycerate mutase [Candidatus Micrarchaeota archaeon]|nr:phosphoglycerate mutase [Candidatus Micrarchaeota archaeon]